MRGLLTILIGLCSLAAAAQSAAASDLMAPYRAQCGVDKIYADCADQRVVLSNVLAAAKAEGKRVVVIFGFNTCGPCNALDA